MSPLQSGAWSEYLASAGQALCARAALGCEGHGEKYWAKEPYAENEQFCSHHDGRVPKWSYFIVRIPRRTTLGERAWGRPGEECAIRVEKIIESMGGRLGLISHRTRTTAHGSLRDNTGPQREPLRGVHFSIKGTTHSKWDTSLCLFFPATAWK